MKRLSVNEGLTPPLLSVLASSHQKRTDTEIDWGKGSQCWGNQD
jgi:hypothetical protein